MWPDLPSFMSFFDAIAALFAPAHGLSTQVRDAIESTAKLVDPMLRAAPRYPQRLATPATQALSYCAELAQAIPGPVDISRSAFAADPLVHAIFGRAADIGEMLGRSYVLREFLNKNVVPESFYALLGMRRKEKRQLGMALEGEAIRGEVPQTLIYFGDHTLTDPAAKLDEAREMLQASMFCGLVNSFALHVREMLREREQASLDRAMERARARRHGEAVQEIAHAAQSRRLREVDAALRASSDDLTPARLMDQLVICFENPKPFLRLDAVEVAVDRMGVVADNPVALGLADTLRFLELTSRDRRQWVVLLARIRCDEALAAVRQVQQATRYIVI